MISFHNSSILLLLIHQCPFRDSMPYIWWPKRSEPVLLFKETRLLIGAARTYVLVISCCALGSHTCSICPSSSSLLMNGSGDKFQNPAQHHQSGFGIVHAVPRVSVFIVLRSRVRHHFRGAVETDLDGPECGISCCGQLSEFRNPVSITLVKSERSNSPYRIIEVVDEGAHI